MDLLSKILIVIVIVLIIVGVWSLSTIKGDGAKCISDPLGYGVKKLASTNNLEVTCSCSATGKNRLVIVSNGTNLILNPTYNLSALNSS